MHYLKKIKVIPIKIKNRIITQINQTLRIVGYKTIRINHKVPIVELSDYTRIWLLPHEIIKYTHLK